jgi:hypothetical protein
MPGMSGRLDPARLTPAASLNRVRFVETTGLALPPDLLGRTAHELLSARALADLVRRHADVLGPGGVSDTDALAVLDRSLVDGPPAAQDAVEAVARRFGERLGWLLAVLRRGDDAHRAARSDWDDTYWRHWAGLSTVYLGGGLVSGRLGPRLVEHAARTLAATGSTDCAIRLAPWPAHLPLIGAARVAPASSASTAVVLDFGHSFVKRASARYEDGALAALRLLPPRPARWTEIAPGTDPTADDTRRLGDFLVATVAEAWRAARNDTGGVSPTVVASLASYLRDGQPLARQGGAYAYLLGLSDNLAGWLGERVSRAVGRPLAVSLLHDGTAAASALAGEAQAAVITLGTSLGVGFPPASGPSRPLAPRFTVLAAAPT